MPVQPLRSCDRAALFSLHRLPALSPCSRYFIEPRLILGSPNTPSPRHLLDLQQLSHDLTALGSQHRVQVGPCAHTSVRTGAGQGKRGVIWRGTREKAHCWMLGTGEGRQLLLRTKPAEVAARAGSAGTDPSKARLPPLENLGQPCETLFPSPFLGSPIPVSAPRCPQTHVELDPCPASPHSISLNPSPSPKCTLKAHISAPQGHPPVRDRLDLTCPSDLELALSPLCSPGPPCPWL